MLSLTVAKIIGVTALFLSVGGGLYISASGEHERIARLDAQIFLVKHIREQIDKYLTPVSEIFRRCERDRIEKCLGVSIDERWEITDIEGFRLMLTESEYYSDGGEIFDEFLSTLGSSFKENEVARCDWCIHELTDLRDKLSRELPKERKSRSVLAFCVAAAVVLLLL